MATGITHVGNPSRTPERWTLDVEQEIWPLAQPFAISGRVFCSAEVLVATISDGLHEGRGEAAGVYYLEDTFRMMSQLHAARSHIERGIDRAELRELLPPGGARNAIDCALWELEAKRSGTPVWELMGMERPKPVVTVVSIGVGSPEVMAERARSEEPFTSATALKLKLSGDIDLDGRRVSAVRRARPDAWIATDANQGFGATQLDRLTKMLAGYGVALIEQPLPRGEDAALEGFESPVPIFADESVQSSADIPSLVGRFDGINIKLDKSGGLTEALRMVIEARRLGLQLMVGNSISTSLAIAPAFLLAQLCDFADLDGPVLLEADRRPGATFDEGTIRVADEVWGGAS